ncbi:MAG: ABC transporter substrate-binding protein [Pseudomonadota bacterium]|nr:ABC transporter substrate-binding protein [Pseudomonadota bacterium]
MTCINIQFTRFSAFYSPLILTICKFLDEVGLDAKFSIAPQGKSAIDALLDGSAHLVQSALSQRLLSLEKGENQLVLHFAQINEMDGFFLSSRDQDNDFSWNKLIGKSVLVDHGNQPLAMFKYACKKAGINFNDINIINAGNDSQMDSRFRDGTGDYIHQQGPAPQQLEFDGAGHVVASIGEKIGKCAFSSLAATPEWLKTDSAKSFLKAYKKARAFINEAPASEVSAVLTCPYNEKALFNNIELSVLTKTIEFYQNLGCWSPHIEITRASYEATLDIFEYDDQISTRYSYDDYCKSLVF